jgi:hypothetical protein
MFNFITDLGNTVGAAYPAVFEYIDWEKFIALAANPYVQDTSFVLSQEEVNKKMQERQQAEQPTGMEMQAEAGAAQAQSQALLNTAKAQESIAKSSGGLFGV